MSNNEDSFDTSVLDLSLPAAAAALSPRDRADLFNALKSKLLDFAEQHSDMLKYLSPIVRKRVDVLREIQGQHDELKANFFEEKAALEAKYQKLYEPFYTKRYEIVNGVVEATDEAVMEQGGDKATKEKGVPNFWLNAMKTNEVLEEQITEHDEGALKFLKDIKWCKIDNPKGFKLEFLFDSSPYFKNSVLTKTYHVITEDVEPILYKAIGTEIDWYPGKSLTHIILKKKLRKGSKNTKPITNTENCDSFFNFFNPPEILEDDDNIDEDFADEHWNRLEQDYAVGATIRDKIIPHAVSWFTGEALISQGVGSVEENDDNDDEDDEEEDDGDEEEKYKGEKKRSVGASPVEIQQGERPWECKQQ